MPHHARHRNWRRGSLAIAAGCLLFGAAARADEGASAAKKPAAGAPRYETHVAPIFKANCVRCHNSNARKAELDLSTPEGIFKGGESGPIIELGKLDESLLYDMVHEDLMPPEEDRSLAKADVETIGRWIEAGAPFVAKIDPAELSAAGEVSNHDIEPLMLLRCAVCHGLRVQEAGLDLRTKATMLKGGKSGPAITLGKPGESLMLKRIHAGEMPPRDKLIRASVRPMTADEIDKLARWIELGAPETHIEPDVATTQPDPLVTEQDRQFWSFQPPRKAPLPVVQDMARARNPIDVFLLRKLEAEGLGFSPEADKLTLLRRVCFDLTGLPPEREQIDEFLADDAPRAYERMVDRTLASRRYGERWARLWLDLAGYADSEGKRSADPIRPNAYRYRDYVIRAFNDDKPYDRFLLEQIAGDELEDYEHAEKITQPLIDNLVATGFLRMAPDGTGSDVVNRVPERMEVIADEIDIFSSTVLGLTIKCARCHSHKYDPIPHRDYYRLMAIFKGAYDEHDWLKPTAVVGQTKSTKPGRVIALATEDQRRQAKEYNAKVDDWIAEAEAKFTRETQRLQEEMKLDKKALRDTTEYRAKKRERDLRLRDLKGRKVSEPRIRALWDRGAASPTYIYRRGDYLQPGRLVGPGVPSMLTDGKTPFDVRPPWPGAKQSGRRLALARWLIQPENPLTARVMINRVWKGHFGQGIVKSTGNFGKLGTRPTHPELLDWLAVEFVEQGWSLKAMHRLLLTSSAYRQVSTLNAKLIEADPDNSLLSRMPLRRMDAEELRDTLLLVSGKLDETPFGRPDDVQVRGDGLVTSAKRPNGWRRSVYIRQRRKEVLTVLETFDLPGMNPNCQERVNSTVAQQALYLTNNAMVRKLAESFARRVQQQTGSPAGQIENAFWIALNRAPSEDEARISRQVLDDLTRQWKETLAEQGDSTAAAQRALETYCHTIMNSAGFLYID